VRARFETIAPALARVELANEIQQARGCCLEMRCQLGDLVAKPLIVSRASVGWLDIHASTSFY